jgi:aspartyl-tRNA(Asn)/glutamyl-tRNA(Gln) amidotransferase subunit C
MELTDATVKDAAHLARIELSVEESGKLALQFKDILDFIDKLKEINIENISPTSHVLSVNTVLRDDQPVKSLPIDKTLKNAPLKEGNFFGVPKIID